MASAMVGNVFLHLAVEGSTVDIRRIAVSAMNAIAPKHPQVINRVVSASLKAYLTKAVAPPTKAQTSTEETETKTVSKEGRLSAFLISCAAVGADVEQSVRESLVLDLLIVSYHPAISTSIRFPACSSLTDISYSWSGFQASLDRPLPGCWC